MKGGSISHWAVWWCASICWNMGWGSGGVTVGFFLFFNCCEKRDKNTVKNTYLKSIFLAENTTHFLSSNYLFWLSHSPSLCAESPAGILFSLFRDWFWGGCSRFSAWVFAQAPRCECRSASMDTLCSITPNGSIQIVIYIFYIIVNINSKDVIFYHVSLEAV